MVSTPAFRRNPFGWGLLAVMIGTPANALWRINVVESVACDWYLYWLLQVPGIAVCGLFAFVAADWTVTRLHAPAAGGVRG